MLLSGSQVPSADISNGASNGCVSPDKKQPVPFKTAPRPLSPDSPEIINELQHYTGAVEAGPNREDAQTERTAESNGNKLPSPKLLQTSRGSVGDFPSGAMNHHDAPVTNVIQPNMDATAAQDLRTGCKRKASTPSLDERPSKHPSASKHSSAPMASQGFPFTGGFGLPPLGLNPAMMSASLGHPLFMGAGSPYFQSPHTQLGEPCYMYPDMYGLGGTNTVTTAASSSSTTNATAVSSCSSSSSSASIKAASSLPGALPPFMLSSSMAGMLPSGFPLSYSQSLASLYTGSMLPGGLPGPAATPGPAGASFLSQYPPAADSSSCSSSPSSFSPSAHSEGHRGPVLVNGGNVSSSDDEVIEVKGQ